MTEHHHLDHEPGDHESGDHEHRHAAPRGPVLTGTPFPDDDGSPDPAVLRALRRAALEPGAASERDLLDVVATARWLLAILPVPGERETAEVDGLSAGDLAMVTMTAPDGARALPVFTSVAAVAQWNPAARPLPLTARAAAEAALAEECPEIVLDVGQQVGYTLRHSMVWALAHGHPWLPAHEDPVVVAAVADAVTGEPAVAGYELTGGHPPEMGALRIALALRPGLPLADVEALVARIGGRLVGDDAARVRIDGLRFGLRPSPSPAG